MQGTRLAGPIEYLVVIAWGQYEAGSKYSVAAALGVGKEGEFCC